MIPFRKILFPVDFSEPCRQLTPFLKDMVRQFSAELVLVRAVDYPSVALGVVGIDERATPRVPAREEIHNVQARGVKAFVSKHISDVAVRTIIEEGDPASVIKEVIKREGADLIMMPTHGEGKLRRLLLGSVTTKVLHDASCAVWTGTSAALSRPHPVPYKSILCALGLTEESSAVLQAAVALAKHYGASLRIVHSVETPPAAYEVDYEPFRQELVAAAETELRELRSRAHTEAPTTVCTGPLADVVREEALKHSSDLVITGRGHAQGGLSRVWSALYGVVREAPCPVLSI